MKYVYMDNYRGFQDSIVPLRDTTFLVGENSTGKSSFLSLVYLLSTTRFWFNQEFSPNEFCNLGGFADIVSISSKKRTYFKIGVLTCRKPKNARRHNQNHSCKFAVMTFRNEDGVPRLCRYLQFVDGDLTKLVLGKKQIKFKTTKCSNKCDKESDAIHHFRNIIEEDLDDKKGYTKFPDAIKGDPPLPFLLAVIQSTDELTKKDSGSFRMEIPVIMDDVTWLAPIRTKPRRTYDGFKTNFTPEGDHTPYVIRKTLRSREKAKRFTELLRRFGKTSGLFSSVNSHSFGKNPAAPFEVQVHLAENPLNISNVGYGVSQALPVVVEMLTSPKENWFAIQQPEVHLHPRAQAALGELMHFLVKERDHHYIIETHSDYLIDRFRLGIKKTKVPKEAQVVFFERTREGNQVIPLKFSDTGGYPPDQPKSFRSFFIKEEMQLLEI